MVLTFITEYGIMTADVLEDPNGFGYTAQCIEVQEATSEGDTIFEALENLKETLYAILTYNLDSILNG